VGLRQGALESMVIIPASCPAWLGPAWAGKNVLVTGHTGFKGAWLSLWLAQMGAHVHGLALPPDTQPSLFAEAVTTEDVTHHVADLRDPEAVERCVADATPDIVFHLAAQPLVRRSYTEPVETFATNVMGTIHLLQALRAAPTVKAIVVVTSDKAYLNREWAWAYREDEALGGYDPYSASKAAVEIATASWRDAFFRGQDAPAIATARAGNVIGGGDWAEDRLLPDIVRAASSGRPVILRNPSSTRPWQHVLEPLAGYLMLAEHLLRPDGRGFAEAWNFGPPDSDAIPVRDIVAQAATFWGEGFHAELGTVAGPHEAHFLKVDASKARARLQWRPRLPIQEAIRWTISWYARHHRGEPARHLALEQLAAYADLVEKAPV
jgi:CDP-glucose 4,6-dehydratase